MALNNAALVVEANAFIAAYPYISLHTSGAVTSSTSESTAGRVAAGWVVDASGNATITNKSFTGGAASGPAVRVGYWTAATAGSYGGGDLFGAGSDLTFNAAGNYTITSVAENATSA